VKKLKNSIALIEFSKIAAAIKAADQLLKAAEVKLIHSKFICPGKYSVLISGNLSSVESALTAGLEIGHKEKAVVESFLIANIATDVMNFINHNRKKFKGLDSLAVLEYKNIATVIKAADTAVKSAKVELIKLRLGMAAGGKGIVILTGDTEACKQALNAVQTKIDNKYLISKSLISSADKQLLSQLIK
jgi:microcompartment protein CcmL/EutN